MVHEFLLNRIGQGRKSLAILIDPGKCPDAGIEHFLHVVGKTPPDLILVGGSLVIEPVEPVVERIKRSAGAPVVLYPGSPSHLARNADAVLFLSMISGRNPELLIGNHVAAAPFIRLHKIETIPTGYMLIEGGCLTSVGYMSQTTPIPANKIDIAVATAMAGEMLGLKMIYLDAGSGAVNPVSPSMITAVRNAVNVPLMVGGGITSTELLKRAFKAGADIVVVGNVLEKDPGLVGELVRVTNEFNARD